MVLRTPTAKCFLQTTAAFVIVAALPVAAYAEPQGGSVSAGSASISSSNGHTIIDQASDRAIIRWDSFDVDTAEHVQFRQPSSSSITVNRIMDSKATRIDGRLSANGNIILINPNGMVFGSSAVVDVGGLVATTSDLEDDSAFMNGGAVKFTKPGKSDAKIVNNGTMTVKDAGLAGLVAPQVENNGVIQARMGRVQLASGDIHTIDFAGDGLIKLEVSAAVTKQSVINRGTIDADGGDVLMTAAQARHVVDALVENTGTVRAHTAAGKKGAIRISTKGIDNNTEKANGRVVNTGTLSVQGDDLGEDGGAITILSDAITLGDGSVVDASGDTDGGTIRVGGDYQGGGNLPTGDYLRIDRNAILNASSRRSGQGGRIIGWADRDTFFYGHADASAVDGDAGLIEMSGKRYLDFDGTVDLLSVDGARGVLLLDPTNITISSSASSNVTGTSPYSPTGDDVTSVLNSATLLAALASGNVIVQTRATGAQAGNITVSDALSWASGNTLTLDAHGQIIVNAAIAGGSVEMIAGADVALNATLAGTGNLTIQQRADATTIGIGASAVGTVNLNAADLLNIQDGWANIILGRGTATAAMDIRDTTWADNLTLRSGTGAINVNGITNVNANNMTVVTGGDIAIAAAGRFNGTGVLTITPSTTTTTVGLGAAANINLTTTEIGRLNSTWSKILVGRTDSTATVSMAAVTWGDALTVMNGTGLINVTGTQTMGANALTFITDGDITLGLTNALTGSGTLTFQQASAATGIGLGTGQTGVLNLTTTEVGRITNGWSNIVFGRTDSTGAINMTTLGWNDAVTLYTGTGAININGVQTMNGNALNMTTAGGAINVLSAISQSTGAVNMATAGGNITVSGGITQTTGGLNMNSGGGNIDITSAMSGTTTGTWTIDSAGGALNVSGNLTKTGGALNIAAGAGLLTLNNAISASAANTAISVSGAGNNILVNNTLSVTTGTLSLTTAGGFIKTAAPATITQTTGSVTLNSNGGAVTLNGAIVQNGAAASGNFTILSGGGAITINNSVTRLAGTFAADAAGADIEAAGLMNMAASAVDFDTMGAGKINIAQDLTMTTGALSLNTVGGSISTKAITQTTAATNIGSTGGAVKIDGAISKAGGTLDVNSGAGQLTFAGGVSLGAGAAILTTDSNISLGGNFSGTGALTIAQASNGISMGIGTGETGTVHIDDTEFAYLLDGWSTRTFGRSDSTAALNVKGGLAWTDSLVLQTGTGALNINGALAVGTGNALTLRTDSDIYIGGALSGTGAFALVQASAGASMAVGNGQTGTVHVSTAEQALILDGWSGRTFGRTDSTGALGVDAFSWTDSLVLRSGTGVLSIAGATMAANSITLITESDLAVNGNVTGTGTLAVYSNSGTAGIGLGDGEAGALQLSNTELTRFGTTWTNLYFGTTTQTADINIGTRTWSDPLNLRTGTGNILVNGVVTLGGNNLGITTDGDMTIGAGGKLTGTGTLTIAPTLAATSYGLGDGQSGSFMLTTDEIGRMNGTFSSIAIGSTSATGSMNVAALTWNDSVTLRTGAGALNINGAQNMGGNNLTLTTNSNIAINANLSGTGTLTLTGSSTSTSIGVGTGQAGTFSLSDDELDRLATGWTTVVVGSTSLTTALNIAGRTWNNSMDFRTNSGALNINGAQNMGSNNLTLRTNTNLAIGQILAGTGTLSILNSGTGTTNSMGVGDGQTGQLHLSEAEINMFRGYGWGTVALGNNGSQGALNVGAGTWASNLILRTAGSASNYLRINGVVDVGSKNLTLQSNNDIFVDYSIKGSGTLTIGQVSATVSLGIGDGQAGTVAISNAELARATGWDAMVFGTTATTTSTYQAINIGAYTWSNDVTVRSVGNVININGAQNLGANDFTINTSVNPAIKAAINGTGTLSLIPYAANVTVGIAGGSGTVNLDSTELALIGNGWGRIAIGRADSTSAMNVGSRTWGNDLFLTTGSGTLSISGANMGANDLEIATNSNLAIGGNLSGSGTLTIRNSSGINSIGVGQTGSNITLDATELGRIVDGWNYVQIGSENSFGVIDIGANTWVNPMRFVTKGNIVINGVQNTTETSGTSLVFATTAGSFVNNAGASAINAGGGRALVYSVDENNDTIGGLLRPTILTNMTYSGYGPSAVTETGDVYIYSGTAAKILTLQIDDVDKIYGDLNPTFTYSYIAGLQNGDLLSGVVLSSTMTAVGSNVLDNAGTLRTITGNFTLDGGYSLNLITGTLTVVKASVTVTADSDTREYGVANSPLTVSYDGFRNGDDETMLSSQATAATAATILSDVGQYAITASGASDSNYDFVYVDGALSVTKAELTATVQNATRVYGDANPAFNIVYSGFRNGDVQGAIDTLASATTAATAASNVGNYAISGTGAIDNNYSFNYVNGTLAVTKATLTATADNQARTYGDANPALTLSYSGFRNSDTASVLDTGASASTTATALSAVGSYAISATGGTDNNYSFNHVGGTLAVNKATLSVTAENNTRVYGDANPALTVSYAGFKNGETSAVLDTQATAATAATILSDAGTYAITASGAASGNYDFSYINGSLTVTKAQLTATAQDATRIYGDANPALTIAYSGFRNGDTQTVIDMHVSATTAATAASNVNSYSITASGGLDNNYSFNYVNGTLSVTKATLTAKADNQARVYGDSNPALTVSYSGFRNGDTATALDTGATASTAANALTGVGTYTITAAGGIDNNYDFSYAAGNLTIGKASLTVNADNNSRTYGAANPALTVSYSGFKNGETSTVLGTQATASTAANAASDAGTYAITAGGAASSNYDFIYNAGTLTVNKATLNVTASSGTRVYGDANPVFTAAYSGFVNGEDQSVINTLANITAPGTTANVGTHAVTASGAFDNNYTFNYIDGVLTVTKAMLTATADNATRASGQGNPSFTVTYTGFRNGESAAVIDTLASATSAANALSGAGTYVIAASGAVDNNYNFSYIDGVLTVTAPVAAPAVVTAGAGASIPETAEDALTNRSVNHFAAQHNRGFNPSAVPRSEIVVISEDGMYNRNGAANDFLIAITDRVRSLEYGYAEDESQAQ